MQSSLNFDDLVALLMVLFTLITTVANILLWNTTRQTVQLLLEQVRHQIATGYSQAQSRIIDAHRELFLAILNNPSLLESFTSANDLDPKTWEIEKIAEFLINQVLIGYLNFTNGIISLNHFDGFKRDARDVFAYESVRQHWHRVRVVHSDSFRRFVEMELLWEDGK
ncbi:hypothetical protein IQ249_15340 [Lusitaniella coriacea LEGE 07157]|uniref:Uncharacterized protein n=1 Tax=Lusitaniella coriacea LEGE 07157 TaxID=945747 RepID=A0A8J7J3Z8_9CYAN|nr:hypothetical protein [Lusitaniella coriacea]MBE9117274.1 hypothetical protein [Lusitaniella coriacea LEGE 07157]